MLLKCVWLPPIVIYCESGTTQRFKMKYLMKYKFLDAYNLGFFHIKNVKFQVSICALIFSHQIYLSTVSYYCFLNLILIILFLTTLLILSLKYNEQMSKYDLCIVFNDICHL